MCLCSAVRVWQEAISKILDLLFTPLLFPHPLSLLFSKVQMTIVWNASGLRSIKQQSERLLKELLVRGGHATVPVVEAAAGDTADDAAGGEQEGQKKQKKKQKKKTKRGMWHSIWAHTYEAGRHDNAIFGRDPNAWHLLYGADSGASERLGINAIPAPLRPVLYFPPTVFRQVSVAVLAIRYSV